MPSRALVYLVFVTSILWSCQPQVVEKTTLINESQDPKKDKDIEDPDGEGNSPPTLTGATLNGPFFTNDTITVQLTGVADADGEVVTFTYRWFVDGAEVSGETGKSLGGAHFDKSQTVQAEVTPHDAAGPGQAVQSNLVTIQNSPPTPPAVSLHPGDLLSASGIWAMLDVPATDADGDTLTYSYVWFNGESPLPYSADTTFVPSANYAYRERWRIEVTATDSSGASVAASAARNIIFDRAAQLALGAYHTCLLTESGAVRCWGLNDYGVLGLGYQSGAYSAPQNPSGLGSGMTAIAAGYSFTCALSDAGAVFCWGRNDHGQIGNGASGSNVVAPFQVTDSAIAVGAGRFHACAVLQNGGVKCWGNNSGGQLGTGAVSASELSPVLVAGLGTTVVAVAAGQSHTCALTSAGGVKCWGGNSLGQVGNGSAETQILVPSDVAGLTSGVSTISAGHNHTCALLLNGTMHCWGSNSDRQLQPAVSSAAFSTPEEVQGLPNGVGSLGAGFSQSCAVSQEGEARCWGRNVERQLLPSNSLHPVTAPVPMTGLTGGVQSIATGYMHTCAITLEGGVECWGNNEQNQLGVEARMVYEPRQVPGYESGVASVSLGNNFGCLISTSAALKCWGSNAGGATGTGAYTGVTLTPTQVTGLNTGVSALATGSSHSCAIVNGGVKCWGANNFGQIGINTTSTRELVPADVPGLTSGVAAIESSGQHTCALTDEGGVYCWGRNEYGQIGNASLEPQPAPFEVTTGATAISVGDKHSCAVVSGGAMYCWGRNSSGELGAGAMATPITTPVRVDAPAVEFVAAAAGCYHTCGLTAGGGVKCWGVEHTLGTGSSSSAAVTQPVDVSGLASGISSLSASWNHTCAVENTGRLLCWGNGNSGVLGNGTNNAEYLPTQAADYNTGVAQADIGTSATCAVTTFGALQCWGSNQYYAVVDGSLYTPSTPVIVTEY